MVLEMQMREWFLVVDYTPDTYQEWLLTWSPYTKEMWSAILNNINYKEYWKYCEAFDKGEFVDE